MALPVALVGQTAAVAALKEGVALCHNIAQYRLQAQQIEVQRETMHRQADQAMKQLQFDYDKDMAKIAALAQKYDQTLSALKQPDATILAQMANLQSTIDKLLLMVVDPSVASDTKQGLLITITQLSKEQSHMAEAGTQNSRAPLYAFALFADSLRDNSQPPVFTDVS